MTKSFTFSFRWLKCVPRNGPKNLCNIDFIIQIRPEIWKSEMYQVSQSLKLTNGFSLYVTKFQKFDQQVVVKSIVVDFDYLSQHVNANGSLILIATLEVKYMGEKRLRKINNRQIANLYTVKQFKSILNDPTFTDFTFIVQSKKFNVHKAILAAASDVMRKIFTTNLLESKQGHCCISFIEPEIFEHLLRFIYTGQLPEIMDGISIQLLKAAHYYGISHLIEICKENLHFKINAENAVEIYEFASIYDLADLKLDAWNVVKW